jgi:hypothetical protein
MSVAYFIRDQEQGEEKGEHLQRGCFIAKPFFIFVFRLGDEPFIPP